MNYKRNPEWVKTYKYGLELGLEAAEAVMFADSRVGYWLPIEEEKAKSGAVLQLVKDTPTE